MWLRRVCASACACGVAPPSPCSPRHHKTEISHRVHLAQRAHPADRRDRQGIIFLHTLRLVVAILHSSGDHSTKCTNDVGNGHPLYIVSPCFPVYLNYAEWPPMARLEYSSAHTDIEQCSIKRGHCILWHTSFEFASLFLCTIRP